MSKDKSEFIKIGDYKISHNKSEPFFWLEHESGESMTVKPELLEKLIDTFYKENF